MANSEKIEEEYSKSLNDEESVFSAGWVEYPHQYSGLIDLRGKYESSSSLSVEDIRREGLKVQPTDDSHVIVSGQRRLNGNEWVAFRRDLKPPADADVRNTTAVFIGDILSVRVPKKVEKPEAEPQREMEAADRIKEKINEEKKPNINAESSHEHNDVKLGNQNEKIKEETEQGSAEEKKSDINAESSHEHKDDDKQGNGRGSRLGSLMATFRSNQFIVIATALAVAIAVLVGRSKVELSRKKSPRK